MEKKKVIKLFGALFLLILIFLPGYSKFQELAERNKALEEKMTEATATITAQAAQITALQASIDVSATAQKAHQGRAEKAIAEVATLLVTLNSKPELTAPTQQAQLAAVEAATKAKVDAAMSPEGLAPLAKLQRYTYNADGSTVATPLH